MPPNDHDIKHHLLALGSAAVIAVYGAGFVRTQGAAARFDESRTRRRPAAAISAPHALADVSSPAPVAPAVADAAVPNAANAITATVPLDTTRDATVPVAGAAKRQAEVTAPAPADSAPLKMPVDSTGAVIAYKDGIYTGWGKSRHGDIESRVEIRNGRIFAASIAQCLTMYSVYWIAALPPQVAKRQSPEVDFVSGATESTNAFYYGVVEALKKAK